MPGRWLNSFLFVGGLSSGFLLSAGSAEACGGVTTFIADRPEALKGVTQQRGHAYQIALLLGDGEEYRGITEKTWMSDQVVVRVGGPSTTSIYLQDPGRRGEE
jgi:hypothetical protein